MKIDGKNAVLGRLATKVAKKLMQGEGVEIYNAGEVIVTGNKKQILGKFHKKKERGLKHHGPKYPTLSKDIVRRAIRGMVPYKKPKGRKALKKLKVYNKKAGKNEEVEKIGTKDVNTSFLKIKEISNSIGD